ncbi:unnamed protein product [Rhizoctonia solani]|uniref:Protein kinase domain-containing protein n=1 Tax=Rhizoctonia solani TaxID=456999 RepID=A0A8H2XRF4_9AGAM|nr:unnamed protein product [Rhizoctonia solani]
MSALWMESPTEKPSLDIHQQPDTQERKWFVQTASLFVIHAHKHTLDEIQVPTEATPPTEATLPMAITAEMSLSEILMHLKEHGCKDITSALDISKCSEYPVSNGGSGNIYRGFLHDGTKVGIKCLKLQLNSIGNTEKHIKHAAKELYTWSKCKHPNIVQLIGMAKFRDQIAMVSPWMENGTLSGSLSRHPRLNRYEVCVQIAEGVAHLHASKIIHGDIKGSNILVSDDLIPKLADFGNSLVNETNPTLPFSDTTSPVTMSTRWAAPEIFEGPIRSSYEADVYALGMVSECTSRHT